jgi:hypothetical protein
MNLTDELNKLAAEAAALSSDIETDVRVLSSESALLDVRYRGRLFVLDYSSTDGFGVDEFVPEIDGLGSEFEHNYHDLTPARERLLALLTDAIKTTSVAPE